MKRAASEAPSLRPTSVLSAADIAEIRRRIGDHPFFRLYFETALEALHAGEDNRRFLVSEAGGLVQVIDFDTLTVMTVTGALTPKEARILTAERRATELHLEPALASDVRATAGMRVTEDLELRFYLLPEEVNAAADPRCQRLDPTDLEEVRAFARRHNPKTVFSDWMIALPTYALRHAGEIMAMGGVIARHPGLHTALLGNFITAPAARRRGFAKALCKTLIAQVRHDGQHRIGLCTTTDNVPACRAYEGIGFRCIESRIQIELSQLGAI